MQLNRSVLTLLRHRGVFSHRAFCASAPPAVESSPLPTNPYNNDDNIKNFDNTKPGRQVEDKSTVYFTGMSKFCARKDLEVLLGPHKPIVIDPLLTMTHNVTGNYGLKFATREEAESFRKYISLLPKTPGGPHYSVHDTKWHHTQRSVRASTLKVTNRTIRFQLLVKPHVFSDRILTHFEDYNLREEMIDKITYGQSSYGPVKSGMGQTSHYLLHFESHDEAVRAVVENYNRTFFGETMKLDLFLV
uniref:Uncharacterized protein n=1 Tax=Spumella elongata TaxID=89044 RepID=A0A7S3GWT0_9STRA|mmetsp:Transcript_23152/g.40044  ORF Transcript_23152/g.40044 Transcript_23152/m.40044 type:complete len:246 (+) Transcript_23152:33-770(+)